MNLRQLEYNIDLAVAVELHQFFDYRFIVEVGKSFRNKFSFRFYTRGGRKIIITTEIIFIKEQVHLFTTVATKYFFISHDGIIARFAAMVARLLYGYSIRQLYFFFSDFYNHNKISREEIQENPW